MTQASPQWQRLISQFWHTLDSLLHSRSFKRSTEAIEHGKGWLLCLAIVLLLLIWNWQLVVSGGVGLSVLVWLYLVQQGQWRLPLDWRVLWQPSHRPVTLASLGGVIASAGTYVSIALWTETQGSWIAKGMILQGLATLAMLLLLGWQTIERYSGKRSSSGDRAFNSLLNDLSEADALKRLIAVRRLTQCTLQQTLQPHTAGDRASTSPPSSSPTAPLSATHLAECFRLMLNRETDPAVCRALLDSLHQLNPQPRSLQAGQAPFSPMSSQELNAVSRHRTEN